MTFRILRAEASVSDHQITCILAGPRSLMGNSGPLLTGEWGYAARMKILRWLDRMVAGSSFAERLDLLIYLVKLPKDWFTQC
tara:strand:+ start:426 stop:671 length:246 start_codon:yes stop_codon:yes gene_type:complete